jgi:hypothetical protein
MKVRTSYPGFVELADRYLEEVFRRVINLQFQQGDGPIIAIQVLSFSYLILISLRHEQHCYLIR